MAEMARTFKNVSPHGDLLRHSRVIALGDTVDAIGEEAERLAEQPFHWLEVTEKKIAAKAANPE